MLVSWRLILRALSLFLSKLLFLDVGEIVFLHGRNNVFIIHRILLNQLVQIFIKVLLNLQREFVILTVHQPIYQFQNQNAV